MSKIVSETGSGRNMKTLSKLRNLLKNSRNTTIVIYSVDRFSRNTIEALEAMKLLAKNNINLISVSENIDLRSGAGRHAFRMRVSAAELETDLLSERVKRSITFKKMRGDHIGTPSYGFTTEFNGKRTLIPCIHERQVINFITKFCNKKYNSTKFTEGLYHLLDTYNKSIDFYVKVDFFEGNSIDSNDVLITAEMISDILNEYGIPKRNKIWSKNSVKNINNTGLNSQIACMDIC